MKKFYFLFVSFFFALSIHAQSLTDDLLMNKGDICIALNISEEKWDHYWEGSLYYQNQNIGTFTKQQLSPMLGFGLTGKINIFAELPYVNTFASGGQMVGVSSFQDFNFGIKYQVLQTDFNPAQIKLLLSANYTMPAVGYLSDYLPFSPGLGAKTASVRSILMVNAWNEKIFFRGLASYSYVGNTEVDRNYYYADGKSYYTSLMDVPSRYGYEVMVGSRLAKKLLHLEAGISNQTSFSGDDIRRHMAPQPTNKMDFTNVSARVRIFPVPSSSVILSYSQTITGRNVGEATRYALGFTHQFNILKGNNKKIITESEK